CRVAARVAGTTMIAGIVGTAGIAPRTTIRGRSAPGAGTPARGVRPRSTPAIRAITAASASMAPTAISASATSPNDNAAPRGGVLLFDREPVHVNAAPFQRRPQATHQKFVEPVDRQRPHHHDNGKAGHA